jgi:hypothetical protein
MHMVLFGTLAVLLWRTGWMRSVRQWFVVLIAWTVVDEVTQALPGIGRHLSWEDLVAGWLGILVVVAWRWALAPVGGASSRARQKFFAASMERVFWRAHRWVMIGAVALAVGLAGGAITYASVGRDPLPILFVLVAGGLVGLHVMTEGLRRIEAERMRSDRSCVDCGASCADVEFEGTTAPCPACGLPQWFGQWHGRLDLPRPTLVRVLVGPVVAGVALFAAMTVAYIVVALGHPSMDIVKALSRFYNTLPLAFRMSIDLTLVLLIAAVVARVYRNRLARIFDGQHVECMYCGHDLRGVPISPERNCSECGRVYHQPPASPGA